MNVINLLFGKSRVRIIEVRIIEGLLYYRLQEYLQQELGIAFLLSIILLSRVYIVRTVARVVRPYYVVITTTPTSAYFLVKVHHKCGTAMAVCTCPI